MPENVVAIVPAAGSSSRMGGGTSKLLSTLEGKTVLEMTLQALAEAGVSSTVILARELDMSAFRRICVSYQATVHLGGLNRQESVSRGIEALRGKIEKDAIVVVHDGARCLVSPELIRRSIEEAREHGAVTMAVPVVDSLAKGSTDGAYVAPVRRDELWQIQTPQTFRFELLERAHAGNSGNATDDASLVSTIHPVKIVLGEKQNIKITTPDDLAVAEMTVRSRGVFRRVVGA